MPRIGGVDQNVFDRSIQIVQAANKNFQPLAVIRVATGTAALDEQKFGFPVATNGEGCVEFTDSH